MRAHGTAVACYKGQRLPAGTCAACRAGNFKRNQKATERYKATAKGLLSDVRHHAKARTAF